MISKPRKGGGSGLLGLSSHKEEVHPENGHRNLTWLRKEVRKQMDTDVPNKKFVRVVITDRR
jgi:hypothetical protein